MKPATETKAKKIRRLLDQGMTPAQVMKEVGASRYYVYIIKNNLDVPRYAYPGSKRPGPGSGRHKPVPFDDEERAAFAAALSGPPPVSMRAKKAHRKSIPGDLWTARQARSWFLRRFGRHPQRHQLVDFAEEHGIMFKPEDPDDMEWDSRNFFGATFYATQAARIQARKEAAAATPGAATAPETGVPEPEKKRSRRRSAPVEILTESDIAEMELSNKEVREEMARNAAAIAAKSRPQPIRASGPRLGRNDPCPFNPALKFKRCCGADGGHSCTRTAQ